MTSRICAVVLPVLLALGFTVLAEILFGKSHHILVRSLGMLAAGLAGATVTYGLIYYLSVRTNLALPQIGSFRSLLTGIAVGILISVCAALLFVLVQRPSVGGGARAFGALPYRALANVFPAAVEEVGFRCGLVHFLDRMFGTATGLAGGSIPFGLAHLLNRLFGQPFVPMHILAATSAGLLFSAVYLRFGVLYAIGMHWSWNSLCRCWTDLFKLDSRSGTQVFEGAWTTVLVTLAAAAFFILFPRLLEARE